MPSILNATTVNGLVTSADNSGSLQLQTNNGTTAVTIDTSQNVGIGTSSPAAKLHVSGNLAVENSGGFASLEMGGASGAFIDMKTPFSDDYDFRIQLTSSLAILNTVSAIPITFGTNDTERMRITSGGDLLVGTTALNPSANGLSYDQGNGIVRTGHASGTASGTAYSVFVFNGGAIGTITQNGTTAVAYNTSSDYRLKENIAPMTSALAKVTQLKPVTYTWKVDGSEGQGFIAHELQAVVPDCVTGEKDAVDAEGKPVYQGVDTSFLVATLTAAIQELKAELDATKAEVQALKGVA